MLEKFTTKLIISPQHKSNKITIESNNSMLGKEMLSYINNFPQKSTILSIKSNIGYHIIPQNQILFIEVYQRESTIYLKNNKVLTKTPLSTLIRSLNTHNFIQVSKSAVINIHKLQKIEIAFSGNYYGFIDNKKIVISRRYISNLKARLKSLGGTSNENN